MAHLWTPQADDWTVEPLAGATSLGAAAELVPATTPDGMRWVLLAAPAVRVNGVPVDTGLAVLRDRDEIRTDGHRVFFSTETLAAVVPFSAGAEPTICPRCRQEILDGTPAVRCPGCHLWYHMSDALPCWTYTERCAHCPQPTALDAGWQWTPEAL